MPIGDFFVLKGKASHFFYQNRIKPLRDVVSIVHDITSVSTVFIKHFYLNHFFDAWEQDNARRFVIDEDFVSKILNLVKSGNFQVRGNENDARVVAAKQDRARLIDAYVSTPYFMDGAVANRDRFRAYSLSYMLAYSAQQLATAYENNIVAHFSSSSKSTWSIPCAAKRCCSSATIGTERSRPLNDAQSTLQPLTHTTTSWSVGTAKT